MRLGYFSLLVFLLFPDLLSGGCQRFQLGIFAILHSENMTGLNHIATEKYVSAAYKKTKNFVLLCKVFCQPKIQFSGSEMGEALR